MVQHKILQQPKNEILFALSGAMSYFGLSDCKIIINTDFLKTSERLQS